MTNSFKKIKREKKEEFIKLVEEYLDDNELEDEILDFCHVYNLSAYYDYINRNKERDTKTHQQLFQETLKEMYREDEDMDEEEIEHQLYINTLNKLKSKLKTVDVTTNPRLARNDTTKSSIVRLRINSVANLRKSNSEMESMESGISKRN